ncbi:hypothetical protein JOQ06_017528 [Pogonophryne albipinna]|uniref:Uncharacterized protein n=1 Tax=Pogonophryne albipinna TaxID=1090488 RepID=A0AAD6FJT1_9TELE|nr:hypothetical protein JOQ06_017528 [Pogonophryne albipinna]
MSYYMDPVSSYPALHPCDRLGAMRHSGGMAVGLQIHPPGVVHPQHQYHPSQPLYIQDIPLQEVPNGHDMGPTVIDDSGLGRTPREWGGGVGGHKLSSVTSLSWTQGARQGAKGRPSFSQASAGQLEEEGNGVETSEEWAEYSLRRKDG